MRTIKLAEEITAEFMADGEAISVIRLIIRHYNLISCLSLGRFWKPVQIGASTDSSFDF